MAYLSESFNKKKLSDNKINIKTKYIQGYDILERNSDNSKNDDILNGVRSKKEYYIDNVLKHVETEFDTRIEYSFLGESNLDKNYVCPNCGMSGKQKDFIDGCKYCGTYYNIDFVDKELGSKHHYDRVLRSNTYRMVTGIVDLIVSMILSYFFIKFTSRTFNNYDISKIIIYGFIFSVILYYIFYIADAYFVLPFIAKYKDDQNNKQKLFWERTKLDKKTFFNNLNFEVRKYYYAKDNIIDYDILDYISFDDYMKDNKLYVKVLAEVRIVSYINNKFVSKIVKDTYIMKKHDNGVLDVKNGINIINCHNCGASIDILKSKCEYCDAQIKYYQDWIMDIK